MSKILGLLNLLAGIPGQIYRLSEWTYNFLPEKLKIVIISVFVTSIMFTLIAYSGFQVDRAVYPTNPVNKFFEQKENANLSENNKGALLYMAAVHQLRKEMDTSLGWCPNDKALNPFSHLDNRCQRQLGVRHGARRAVIALSEEITKVGEDEHPLTKAAHEGISSSPYRWAWMGLFEGSTEEEYENAIAKLDKFTQLVIDNDNLDQPKKLVDIRSTDFVTIIDIIADEKRGFLQEPYGKLTARNNEILYFKLDDTVYYAAGSALVARDLLVALKSAYPEDLDRGGMFNLDVAIDALSAAGRYNPYWISRGADDSMPKDHRAKVQQYMSDAIKYLTKFRDSLRT